MPQATLFSASPAANPDEPTHLRIDHCLNCGSPDRSEIFVKDGCQLVRCRQCALVYVSNPPTPETLARLYSFASNYHSEFAHSSELREQFLHRGRTYLRSLSRYVASGRLLDVGCSAGFFMKVARDRGWQVTGLEFSPDTAALGLDLYGLEIHTGTLTDHTLPDESWDAITLWDVIEHLPDPLSAMEAAYRLLSRGGYMALSTPNIDGLFPRVSSPFATVLNHWRHPEPPEHLCQFSKRTLASLLQRAGFEIVHAHTRRIPLDYSFGNMRDLLRSPKWLSYAAVFAPFALIGPWIGMGDEVVMIARKSK